jgi:hypothetical protein
MPTPKILQNTKPQKGLSLDQIKVGLPNKKQAATKMNKAKARTLKMRELLWPGLKATDLWLRLDKIGFTTIPRTMSMLINIINDMSKRVGSNKSVPAGKAYLVLWCRVFDEALVKIDSDAEAAAEAGYVGERNVTTWREHLKVLQELGFIDCKEGPAGPYQYVLLFNPYQIVKRLKSKGWVDNASYIALYQRALEIGADDFDEEEPAEKTGSAKEEATHGA